jgi:class 3 adenylate cyclase/predicted metal-dependent HD superfamily phosphohydrolase
MVVYACTNSGITLLKFENNNWTECGKAEGIEHPVTSIAESGDGFVWAGTINSGLYRAPLPGTFLPGALITFTHEPGWLATTTGAVRLADLNHKLLVSTSSGFFQYDEAAGIFTLHPIHKYISVRPDLIQPVVTGTGTKTWFGWYNAHAGKTILMSFDNSAGNSVALDTLEYRRLEKIPISAMLAVEDVLWLAAPDGLVRVELNYPRPDSPHFFTFIDRIIIDQDSTIDRAFLTASLTTGMESSLKPVIPYSRNSIRFEFVSTDFNSEGHALFQYLLTDKNKRWTEWTENNFAELQDLPGGRYVFRVRSKDIYGNVSSPAQIAFRIKAPFYAAWWAFIFYAFIILVIIYFYRKWRLFQRLNEQYKLEEIVLQRTESLLKDKEKTDSILANILPQKTADELKSTGKASTSKYNMVTVLFSDIQGFTKIAEQMNPERLIDELDKFYFQFDTVVEKYNIEKIKTIGDAYMAAGGIPVKNRTNPIEVVLAGLEMQHYMNDLKKSKDYIWDLRIGIHTGSVIAGVVGQKKFSYDIWGDTVNTASRMESSGEAGKVNISGTCHKLVEQFFDCEYRGKMPVKYKGDIDMYFVKGLKPEYRAEFEYSGNHNLQVQLQLLRLQDLEEIILKRLETDLPEYLLYHNADHTAHVYAQVELLGRSEKIRDEEMLLLRTAALLHDIGYIYQFEDHEIKSVEIAKEILAPYRFTQEQIDKICQMILATRFLHKPENLLEQIIIDANLDHLGRVDFLILSDRLFQEYRTMNIINSKKEWNEHQINFLNNHEFYTTAANSLREISKKDQIENIRKFS